MEFVKQSVVRNGRPDAIARAARAAQALAGGPMRRLAKRFPGLKREARTLLQRTRARAYRVRRRLRPS